MKNQELQSQIEKALNKFQFKRNTKKIRLELESYLTEFFKKLVKSKKIRDFKLFIDISQSHQKDMIMLDVFLKYTKSVNLTYYRIEFWNSK